MRHGANDGTQTGPFAGVGSACAQPSVDCAHIGESGGVSVTRKLSAAVFELCPLASILGKSVKNGGRAVMGTARANGEGTGEGVGDWASNPLPKP